MNTKTFGEFLDLFVTEPSFNYVKKGKTYFLEVDDLKEFYDMNGYAISLSLGTEDRFFKPSLFLIELLSKESSNKIFLNHTAEWLFLCGRDAFLNNVYKNNAKSNIFLVQNKYDENIGLGMKTKHKGKNIIKNLNDRGDFLRREK